METDPTVDVEQPGEGQDDATTSSAPYAEYLNQIPEEVRGDVEPVFKEWDANVTRRFQEASEQRQAWEPYEQAGVNRYAPEQVQYALEFAQAFNDPQQAQQIVEAYAAQNGLTLQQAQEQAAQENWEGYNDDGTDLKQILQSELGPIQQQVQLLAQRAEEQEYTARLHDAERQIQSQVDELKQKHGAEVNEQVLETFVAPYIETDPHNAVSRAWADYQALKNQIEKNALQAKVDQPAPAESGGVAHAAPDQYRTLADANKAAVEFLRQSNRA